MLGNIPRTAVVVAFYALVSGLAGWNGAGLLANSGLFGSCFEGGCAYGAILIGFPILWLAFFVLMFASRGWPLGSLFEGWRTYVVALIAFVPLCLLFFWSFML